MEIRKLNAARGWTWVKQGYQLIMRNPLLSVSLALTGALAIFAVLHIPLFGPLLAILFMPVLIAGYMRACRALEENEEVELAHLFAGFEKHAVPLISLGGYMMLGLLIVSMVMIFIGGAAFAKLLESFQASNDPQLLIAALGSAGSGVAFTLLVGFSLVFVLMLALQYAPMLVFFSDVKPLAALRASLAGSLRNIIAYSVYSLIMQVVALVLGVLPYGIGMIALLPLGFTSLYVSYRNIFPFPGEIPPAAE
ncbi:MAG TPA: BPSS1780 family membrane protein [Gallionella sp.]|nr:BPSS1780 family membrane protein [Gallionella sp.]